MFPSLFFPNWWSYPITKVCTPIELTKGLSKVNKSIETEASGGITRDTIRDYALTGVEYISVGALTHSYTSLDMSLKVAIT